MVCYFFFFKQKTAYEMRISDWSSDVCSSDLSVTGATVPCCDRATAASDVIFAFGVAPFTTKTRGLPARSHRSTVAPTARKSCGLGLVGTTISSATEITLWMAMVMAGRSEEHTSELQSLMRISYAVFCLKKKKHTIDQLYNN